MAVLLHHGEMKLERRIVGTQFISLCESKQRGIEIVRSEMQAAERDPDFDVERIEVEGVLQKVAGESEFLLRVPLVGAREAPVFEIGEVGGFRRNATRLIDCSRSRDRGGGTSGGFKSEPASG
ncbi:MAG TPA: hypothetical protein VFW05_14035 [Verrucomicrobiae bacterium]|nr:hypothetical protein [Verrucomicrobiae bacterium]